jgi:putative ABC transport system substrate-binding protein
VFLIFLSLSGCNAPPPEIFTIGVITKLSETVPAYTGFKSGMSTLGYVEGFDLRYIYTEVPDTGEEAIGNTFNDLINRDIDLLLTFEYDITLKCKRFTERDDLSILFISNPEPVEMGLVDSLSKPGLNITGIRMPETTYKALEWLTATVPDAKNIYLPYNPDTDTSLVKISELKRVADRLGISLVLDEVRSVDEAVAAIKSFGNNIDSVFRIPSSTLNPESRLITQAAYGFGIPVCSALLLEEDILMTFTGSFTVAGKQAARMAHQIHKGINPDDLPVETSDAFLIINMNTAEKLGLTISPDVLAQAQKIIR